ncbi:unnamed protein product [Didymodactylos carnosus]|uniref:NAD(P)(+)--arginine ADP-ribosyltransferase n=1 Tax=Didymodactylos carnosus TaxID=1234261 RepID=A0A814N6M7_9BILA|nr:unnamed protein product [Didymodactylos carnosus]CAF1212264.1 unnamed protein product [Didymodactylos carnosus]CAF3851844.1 unnamed protein product [Didymodactylos carnosus]CAF4021189.1 unnamed protein product [Didymodactylos carnosus]
MVSQMINSADQLRAQWYWKSNSDSWSTNEKEEWTKYSDIESAIIEEAFNGKNKTKLADLDNYLINLYKSIQISKSDPNKQRQIKRVLIGRNETQGLREQRFFQPPGLSKTFNSDMGKDAYNFLSQWKKDKKLSDAEIVKQAANGIIIEGKQLHKHCQSRCWDGFTSTTKNHEKAQTFGNILFIIDAARNRGIDITELSHYDEEEVLLPPGTSFTISKLEKTQQHTYIYLQLSQSPPAASPFIQLLVTSSSSDEHCCDPMTCNLVPSNIWEMDEWARDWHSSLAASSSIHLLVTSASSDDNCRDQSDLSTRTSVHLGHG